MGRPSNTEERRDQIVEGLLRVMAERGYERASVAEVARVAGLAPGLLHYHFKSKQEILLRLVEVLDERLKERLDQRLVRTDAGDPDARLRAFVDVHLARDEGADPRALACWVAIAAEAIRQPEVAKAFRQVLDRELDLLGGLVRDSLRARGRPTRRAKTIAAAIFATIEGYYVLAAAAPGTVPAGSAAPTTQRMVEALLEGGK